eukprot:GILJ01006597.1.p1 GENE.GILJ01006597.1~~GILJ01006597.1.p1  ORF type:complete len:2140 (-),score=355.52 GILJ01006597.1:90-6284(-)
MVADNNPVCQEKALDCLQIFISRAKIAPLELETIASPLVDKALASSKSNIRAKAQEALMLFIEIDKPDKVIDLLVGFFKHKNAKVAAVAIHTVKEALQAFGSKKIPVKSFLKQSIELFEAINKDVRSEVMSLAGEAYRWVGDAIKPSLANIRPAQLTELETLFQAAAGNPAQPTRYLRSEQAAMLAARAEAPVRASGAVANVKSVAVAPQAVDAYDLADPVDILAKLPATWSEDVLCAPKWTEKRDKLADLIKLAEDNPRLSPAGDYGAVVGSLKKLMEDSNVVVAQHAVKAIGLLSLGLRADFGPYARSILAVVLSKFKEKKAAVLSEVNSTLDRMLKSFQLDQIMEDVKAASADKAPTVKLNTILWVTRSIESGCDFGALKRSCKALASVLVELSDDSAGDIRDAALKCFGLLISRVGEGPLSSFTAKLQPPKLAKAKEAAASYAGVLPAMTEVSSAEASAESQETKTVGRSVRGNSRPPAAASANNAEVDGDDKSVNSSRPASVPSRPAPAKKAAPKVAAKPAASKKASSGKSKAEPREEDLTPSMTNEEVETQAEQLLPSNIKSGLNSAAWKDKLAALTDMKSWAENNTSLADSNNEVLVRYIKIKLKDWKESNFQVLKEAFITIGYIASISNAFAKRTAAMVIPGCADKMTDTKIRQAALDCLLSMAEVVTPKFIANQLFKNTNNAKNPKLFVETIAALQKLLEEFGVQTLPLPQLIEFLKACLEQSNPQIRTASIALLVSLYLVVGEPLRQFLQDVKDATLKNIDEQFVKAGPPNPTKFAPSRALRGEEASAEVGAGGSVAEMLPRADISHAINAKLLKELNDAQWKTRKAGLDAVEQLLVESNMRIQPNGLGELVTAMKARLSDSNKNLVRNSLMLVGKLAEALGPGAKGFTKTLLPLVLQNLADKQKLLRDDALQCLDKWTATVSFEHVFSYLPPSLVPDSPEVRTELLTWMLKFKSSFPKCDMKSLVKPILACLQDRAPNIRGLAEQLLAETVAVVGFAVFRNAMKDLKQGVVNVLNPIVDKYKSIVPAVPQSNNAEEESKVEEQASRPATAPAAVPKSVAAAAPGGGIKPPPAIGLRRPSGQAPKINTQTSRNLSSAEPSPTNADTSAITITGQKDKRADSERRHKWPSDGEIRAEFVESLKEQAKPCFSGLLIEQMFHADAKVHLQALKQFGSALSAARAETIDTLDIIFKWLSIRLQDGNTRTSKDCLEYIQSVFGMLSEEGYQLNDYEANIIIPCLMVQLGQNQATLRTQIRQLFHMLCNLYSVPKLFNHVLSGLSSKNARAVKESIEEITSMIAKYSTSLCTNANLHKLAKTLDHADPDIRKSAVTALLEAYKLFGDSLWPKLGDMGDKAKDMMQGRIKHMAPVPASQAAVPTATATATTTGRPKTPQRSTTPGKAPRNEIARTPPSAVAPAAVTQAAQPVESVRPVATRSLRSVVSSEAERARDLPPEFKIEMDGLEGSPKVVDVERKLVGSRTAFAGVSVPANSTAKVDAPTGRSSSAPVSPAKEAQFRSLPSSPTAETKKDASTVLTPAALASAINRTLDDLLKQDTQLQNQLETLRELTSLVVENDTHIGPFADAIIHAVTKVLHSGFEKTPMPTRFCRLALNATSGIIARKSVLFNAHGTSLRMVIEELLTRLLIDNIVELEEGEVVLKSLNHVMLRILENCEHTAAFCCLLELLSIHVENKPKLSSLVIKCLLKLTKVLSSFVDSIDLSKLLLAIHKYIVQHPPELSTDEVPLRTIKTILSELVKLKGSALKVALPSTVDENATIVKYIDLMLKTEENNLMRASTGRSFVTSATTAVPTVSSSTTVAEGRSVLGSTSAVAAPSPVQARLLEIFKKLHVPDASEQALQDLYQFQREHASVDIKPHLENTSDHFQSFIQRGLQRIAAKHSASDSKSDSGPPTSSQPYIDRLQELKNKMRKADLPSEASRVVAADIACSGATDAAKNIVVYRDKLKEIKERYGLTQSLSGLTTAPVASTPSAPGASVSSLESLKDRLSEITRKDKTVGSTSTTAQTAGVPSLEPAASAPINPLDRFAEIRNRVQSMR